MPAPLRTSVQYLPLNRKKTMLARRGDVEIRPMIRRYLVPPLLEFELSKLRQQSLLQRTEEPSRAQLERLFNQLLLLEKKIAQLEMADLLTLHQILAGSETDLFRHQSISPVTALHAPLDPSAVPSALNRFFEWVQSPSFSQLHPLEQLTVSQVRLYEIYPFELFSELTISVFSDYFLLAAGFLLPRYEPAEAPEFYLALDAAFVFNTQALIDFHNRACEKAYDLLLSALG